MRIVSVLGFALVALGCTTKTENRVAVATPATSAAPIVVANAFMHAVADSNLAQMGELWGTAKGAASVTGEPANWIQRLTVIHAYLKGGSARVIGENPGAVGADRVQLTVELTRSGCVKSIPFTLVRTKQGAWLVNAIELNAAGVPGRACATNL